MSVMVWLSAIRHSKSAEWHSSVDKWHVALQSYTYAIPCSFMFSCNFLRSFDTQKDLFFNQTETFRQVQHTCFQKNHHLHHCSQKVINSSFLKTHGFMFQTRGIHPRLMHFQKKNNNNKKSHQDFQKSCIHFKLRAFSSTSCK